MGLLSHEQVAEIMFQKSNKAIRFWEWKLAEMRSDLITVRGLSFMHFVFFFTLYKWRGVLYWDFKYLFKKIIMLSESTQERKCSTTGWKYRSLLLGTKESWQTACQKRRKRAGSAATGQSTHPAGWKRQAGLPKNRQWRQFRNWRGWNWANRVNHHWKVAHNADHSLAASKAQSRAHMLAVKKKEWQVWLIEWVWQGRKAEGMERYR